MHDMVRDLGEMAVDEAYGAHKYAKLAVENKQNYPQMAEAVAVMASQELQHAETLLKTAKMILDNHKGTTEHHEGVEYLYKYMHDKTWEEIEATKVCLEKYKQM